MKKLLLIGFLAFTLLAISAVSTGNSDALVLTAGIPLICVPFVKNETFAEKSESELEEMDEKELATYMLAKNEWNAYQLNEKISKLGVDHKEVNSFKESIKEDMTKLTNIAVKQGAAITRLLGSMSGPELTLNEKDQVNEFIEKNAAKIIELKQSGQGFIEITTKAPAAMTTTSASNPAGIPDLIGTQVAPAGNVN